LEHKITKASPPSTVMDVQECPMSVQAAIVLTNSDPKDCRCDFGFDRLLIFNLSSFLKISFDKLMVETRNRIVSLSPIFSIHLD
jgi:hypothetical protein